MPTREIVGFLLGPAVLAVILLLPPWVFLALLAAVVLAAAGELLAMARSAGVPCGVWLPLLTLAALLLAAWRFDATGLAVAAAATLTILPAAQLAHPERPRGGLTGAAVSCFAVLFLGVGGACLGWLRTLPDEQLAPRLVVFFLVCIWSGDSGAYYVGRALGRHHMSPRISPKKTWEGLAGGIAATFAAAAALKLLLTLDLGWAETLGVAAILAVVAPVGDLVESHFKRDTGVKDSSTVLLGHGGFLDRTDSLLFGAPPVLAYLLSAGLLP